MAINATIAKIQAGSFKKGVPKIITILTDGGSGDSVVEASNYARSLGITILCVGIGSNYNNTQLLQIAGSQSNIVYLTDYSQLQKFV